MASTPFPPPQSLLDLNFGDIKTELDAVLTAATTAVAFIDKWGFFVPTKYKDALDELIKLLTWLDSFLTKPIS